MPTAFGSVALQRRTPWSCRVVTVQMGPSPCECGKEMWPSPCGCGVGAAQVLQGNVTQSVPAQMWREAQSDLEDVIACVDVRVGDLDQVLRTLAGDTLQMVPASTELCSIGLAGAVACCAALRCPACTAVVAITLSGCLHDGQSASAYNHGIYIPTLQ